MDRTLKKREKDKPKGTRGRGEGEVVAAAQKKKKKKNTYKRVAVKRERNLPERRWMARSSSAALQGLQREGKGVEKKRGGGEKNVRKYLLESRALFDTHDRQRRGCSPATSGELVKGSSVFPHLRRKDRKRGNSNTRARETVCRRRTISKHSRV